MSEPRLCIVIPAYNEGKKLEPVLKAVQTMPADILVIDDGSSDNTASVAEQYAVHLLRHPSNRGKGAAIRTAIDYVLANSYDAALFMDADGQHLPGEVPRFMDCYRATGADLILGSRMEDIRAMPWIRKAANRFSSWVVSRLAGTRVTDSQSGFRLLSARLLEDLNRPGSEGFDLESEMIIDAVRSGRKYLEVPITCVYADEKSHYHPVRDSAGFIGLAIRKALENRPENSS